MHNPPVIISLGGSLICPEAMDTGFVDTDFLSRFSSFIDEQVQWGRQFTIVTGGGKLARDYQTAYRSLVESAEATAADWMGVYATRLNAQLLRGVLSSHAGSEVIIDPTITVEDSKPVQIAAGWKPGFSTDLVAVMLAETTDSSVVINLSNISHVYGEDPRKNPAANPISTIGWKEFLEIIDCRWEPGTHLPFDPVASRKAMEIGLRVVIADGRNFDNIHAILDEKPFVGTEIIPA